jgi:peptide-methionine (S)-S-oxide reductase
MNAGNEVITLAGGCFWCLEAVYDQIKGVLSVESGYIGGAVENPSYEAVCGGRTGHAEAIRVTYDPRLISCRELVEIFFAIHDPTTLNRQGNDEGTQYRSAIFYHSPEQRQVAEAVKAAVAAYGLYPDPVVTEIIAATTWHEAERYHQEYFSRNPLQGYCQFVISPKVAKFRKQFISKLKP